MLIKSFLTQINFDRKFVEVIIGNINFKETILGCINWFLTVKGVFIRKTLCRLLKIFQKPFFP